METGYDRDREVQARRLVLTVTNQHRESLGSQFESWVRSLGSSLDDVLANHQQRIDDLNSLLVRYGRCLYSSGRPYNHFAETINAVSSRKPAIRRMLQESWNLAFAWMRDEPNAHHVAMPWQILLSCITTCLIWGLVGHGRHVRFNMGCSPSRR